MRTDAAVKAWAGALFSLARAEDAVERVDADLRTAADTLLGHPRLRESLADPRMSPAKKGAVVVEIFGEDLSPIVVGAIVSLVASGKEGLLTRIQDAYTEAREAELNVSIADVTTAVALDGAQAAKLGAKLEKIAGRTVVIREHVDPDILGGVVVRIGGKVMDGSVKAKLAKMRGQLAGSRSEA